MAAPLLVADPPSRIAIVRLRVGLGDLVCGVPGLRALRRALPDAHITLVTYPEVADIVDRLGGDVDELLPFPGHPGIPERPADAAAWAPFVQAARAARFDLALQCYGANTAANEVTAALGARRTGGFFLPGQWDADLQASIPYPVHLHEVERHLALMAHLGAPAADTGLELAVRPDEEAAHADLLAEAGLEPGGYVVLHPGATSPSRRWPAERFAAVGDALHGRGLDVVVTGVAGEEAGTAAVVAGMTARAHDLCGRTTLGSATALVRDAALVVTNDTGTSHLAAVTGTPSVTAFLSGDPVRFAPWGDGPHRIARVQVECNPCHHLDCPIDHRCATRLQPRQVLVAADEVLRAGRAAADRSHPVPTLTAGRR